jgi:GTP-binding protein HflX
VLEELGVPQANGSDNGPLLEVLNKIDLLEPGQREGLLARNGRNGAIAVSALTGDGIPALLAAFEDTVTRDNITLSLKLDAADGSALAFAYRHAQVLERRDRGGKINLSLRIHPDDLGRFENRFHRKIVVEQGIGANT